MILRRKMRDLDKLMGRIEKGRRNLMISLITIVIITVTIKIIAIIIVIIMSIVI